MTKQRSDGAPTRRNGSGSYRRIGDEGSNRWELRVNLGPDPANPKKYMQKSRTFRGTERNAATALRAFVAEVEAKHLRTTRGTLGFVLNDYLEAVRLAGRSPNTVRTYETQISLHIAPELEAVRLADLEYGHLSQFYDKMLRKGLSARTVRTQAAIISAALRRAEKRGWLGGRSNPATLADVPERPDEDVTAPSVEEVTELLREADKRNPVLGALMFTAASTGGRRGEMLALRWSNVDLEQRLLTIGGSVWHVGREWGVKTTKTGKVRRVALDDATTAVLTVLRERQASAPIRLASDPFVFAATLEGDRPYMPDSVTGFFGQVRAAAGLPHVKLHHLRKFMASQLLTAGIDVRTVAGRGGWADTKTLFEAYAAFMPQVDERAARTMGALLRPELVAGTG